MQGALHDLKLLQEQPEARHHETESHQGQAGANPGKQSPLRRQIITEACRVPSFCWPIHILCALRWY